MSDNDKYEKRQYKSASLSTVLSISLVLFTLGLLGFLLINAGKLSILVKENIGFSIILKDDVKEVDMMKLKKMFDAEKFVKSTQFITKEEAAKTLSQDLGEDFLSFLGYNPLLSSIELRLKADYANPDSVKWIEAKLNMHPEVKEIFYQKSLVDFVNENVKKIGFIIIGFASILLIISIALINNTIRLAIYSKRFLIKTMQLVGATKGFIAGPFIRSGILQGITSSIIAIGLLSAVIYFAQTQIPDLKQLHGIQESIILFTSMIVLGILITGISTLFAVRKFLKLSHDELYK